MSSRHFQPHHRSLVDLTEYTPPLLHPLIVLVGSARLGAVYCIMRVGLVRHFPVKQPLPTGWRTAAELLEWRRLYDASAVIAAPTDLQPIPWTACLCSDLPRAVSTARAIYPGEIEFTPLLREAEFAHFPSGNLRLPAWSWRWVLTALWFTGHSSQLACRDDFRRRVQAVADLLEARGGDLLVVSHAGMMSYLSRELRQRGFTGPRFRVARHAALYLFEKA